MLVALPDECPPPPAAQPVSGVVVVMHGVDGVTAASLLAQTPCRVLAVASQGSSTVAAVADLDMPLAALHALLYPPAHYALQAADGVGPSWAKLHGQVNHVTARTLASAVDDVSGAPPSSRWWWPHRAKLVEMTPTDVPLYVYDLSTVRRELAGLRALASVHRFFYAMKANFHPEILREVEAAGLSFECVSIGEIQHVRALFPSLTPSRLLFTPNFAPRSEYARALALGANVTVDNTYCIRQWPDLFSGHKIFLRCEAGKGHGHHAHVRTGSTSKFGIAAEDLPAVAALCSRHGIEVIGLHAHSGSGVAEPGLWADHAATLAALAAAHFPSVRILNLGGGLGHAYRLGEQSLELAEVERCLAQRVVELGLQKYELWMEPGRRMVAAAGIILTRVTQIKEKKHSTYVGVNAGMHNLLRPALYASHHALVNISRDYQPGRSRLVSVCGPICESADVLGRDRAFPADTAEGDVVLVDSTGAYGACMASPYNLRGPAAEVTVSSESL